MKDKLINSIVADMNNYLNNYQLEQLKKNLICTLCNIDFIEKENALNNNIDYKQIENDILSQKYEVTKDREIYINNLVDTLLGGQKDEI